jgi:uncharacterized membrane protein YhaH (DUF805 family)
MEYGLTWLISIPISFILTLLSESGQFGLWLILYIPFVWAIYAQGAKRCHDIGYNGWWQIVPLFFFVLLFASGEPQINKYGAPAK